jgi:hypothetical protein
MAYAPLIWSFAPSEAIDAVVFCNAVSRQEHYASRYPGLRVAWEERLGPEALRLIDEGMGVSLSGLAQMIWLCGVETLDAIVDALARWDTLRPQLQAAMGPGDGRPQHLRVRDAAMVFGRLREAGFVDHWRGQVLPELEARAVGLRQRAAALPLEAIHRELSAFLGGARAPVCTHICLAWYIRPIAFQLPGGAMAMHPDAVPAAARLGQLCLHESLHGFPGSDAALAAQEALMAREPEFARHHAQLLQRWHSGPEEHLVTGAEAYLSERLKLRTRQECVAYLTHQNGGMPFAWAVYERLRDAGGGIGWPGFGAWAAQQMNEGGLRWPGSAWPGGPSTV